MHRHYIITTLVIVTCVTCLIIEISLINQGFDLSDEGFHLGKYKYPQEVKATLIRDHLYTGIIFKLLDYNLGSLRLVNISVLVLISLVIGYGSHQYVTKVIVPDRIIKINPLIIICSIIIFQLPSLWIERVPAYNNIASFCNLSITGFLFFAMSGIKSKIIPFLIGFLLCFSAIVKPPSGITMAVFIVTLLLINNGEIKFFFSVLFGVFVFALIHFTLIESPFEFFSVTKNGFLHYSYFDGTTKSLIMRYTNELWGNIIFSVLANKYELLFVMLLSIYIAKSRLNKLFYIFILLSFILISFKHYLFGDLKGGMGLYWSLWRLYIAQFIVVSVILISFIICKRDNMKGFFINKIHLTSFCIILTPILFAFGTGNLITFNMNFYTSLFFIGILCLSLSFLVKANIHFSSYHISFFLYLASICPTYAYLHGRLLCDSYTISEPSIGNIFKNSEIIHIYESKLKVTDSIKQITHSLRSELTDYHNDLNYLINLSHMYGLNFLCDLPHPIQPWTGNMRNNFTLENIDSVIFQSSAILYRTNDKQVFEQLSKSFPGWKISHPNSKNISYNIKNKELSLTLLLPNNE